MPEEEVREIQATLDSAFADFKSQNPELAKALEVLNISYREYLCVLMGIKAELQTVSGSAINS